VKGIDCGLCQVVKFDSNSTKISSSCISNKLVSMCIQYRTAKC
jgi:hypothetical protein